MTVAVVGGTGTIGAATVAELARGGVAVRVISRHGQAREGVGFRPADLRTGAGLAEALAGCAVVINAVNGRRATMIDGLRRLLEAEQHAGVRHHVEISIVGVDKVPMGYYQVKVHQEQILAEGPVPWTLQRATQFHTLVRSALEAAARLRVRPAAAIRVQPVAPQTVGARLAELAHGEPAGRVPDLGGPRAQTVSDLARAYASFRGLRLVPVPVPAPGRVGRAVREGALCVENGVAAGPTFAEWLTH